MFQASWSSQTVGANVEIDNLVLYNDDVNILAGQTSIRVEWSKNGSTWSGTDVDVDGFYRKAKVTVPPATADGTEWLVRFVVAGVTYGPLSVRFYL